jgi:hypothetical protein
MSRCLFLILAFIAVSCSKTTPEEQAAMAAKSYYDRLVEGYAEGFLEGKAGVDSLPSDYCDQLLEVYKQYMSETQKKHGGIREVRISENVGRSDSTLRLTYAFLMLCYGDSTQEEITVPMVQDGDEWRMK